MRTIMDGRRSDYCGRCFWRYLNCTRSILQLQVHKIRDFNSRAGRQRAKRLAVQSKSKRNPETSRDFAAASYADVTIFVTNITTTSIAHSPRTTTTTNVKTTGTRQRFAAGFSSSSPSGWSSYVSEKRPEVAPEANPEDAGYLACGFRANYSRAIFGQ